MGVAMSDQEDNLFAKSGPVKPFEFDESVAQVFDNMISRSVPFYQHNQEQILNILQHLDSPPKCLYDLGTSTGALLFFLSEHVSHPMQLIGIDNSEAMIQKAKTNLKNIQTNHTIEFQCNDILECDFPGADVIILNYVLQFIEKSKRLPFLKRIHENLPTNGILIVSEKTNPSHAPLSQLFIRCHESFKEQKHYSHLEIAQKRKALENVLVPLSLNENQNLLAKAGFKNSEPFLLWHNFASLVAVKS